MANNEQLIRLEKALEQGGQEWNDWRRDHPEERIDLREADLQNVSLAELDLRQADLTGANLRGADLTYALLHGACLRDANLESAELKLDAATVSVPVWNQWREANPNLELDLGDESFEAATLDGINLSDCVLRNSSFKGTRLVSADLRFADLIDAVLTDADLSQADLSGAYLCGADLDGARLTGANLQRVRADSLKNFVEERPHHPAGARDERLRRELRDLEIRHQHEGGRREIDRPASLSKADLSGANLDGGNFYQADFPNANLQDAKVGANLRQANLFRANLRGADLSQTNLEEADLRYADLRGAQLQEAFLGGAELLEANLERADLRKAYVCGVDLTRANIAFADLRDANLSPDVRWTRLNDANLTGADLRDANLRNTYLTNTNLSRADLAGAVLEEAQLIRTDLRGAKLSGAAVYGVSVWDVITDGVTTQEGLIITPASEPKVTVDDLAIAQFVYLLLNNTKIRDVIHTITSKAVLILGRFTKERKPVLDALHSTLRTTHDLVPIVFDFEPSPTRDLTETVQLLANLCRFVIADVTDAKSIPQELSHIIPFMPSVPIQPIILSGQLEFAMFEHWRKYSSVLPEFVYTDEQHLVANVKERIILAIEEWEADVKKSAMRERLLHERIKRLEAENAALKSLHQA